MASAINEMGHVMRGRTIFDGRLMPRDWDAGAYDGLAAEIMANGVLLCGTLLGRDSHKELNDFIDETKAYERKRHVAVREKNRAKAEALSAAHRAKMAAALARVEAAVAEIVELYFSVPDFAYIRAQMFHKDVHISVEEIRVILVKAGAISGS